MSLERLFQQLLDAEERGAVDEMIPIWRDIESFARDTEDYVVEAVALRGLGNCHHERGDLKQAHSFRVEAASRVELAGDRCPLAVRMSVEGDLGRSYIEVHNWPKGEVYTRKALQLAELTGDEHERRLYQINLGFVWANTQRKADARRLAEEVLEAAEQMGDDYLLALQHLNLGVLMLNEFRLYECQRHARQAMIHADRAGKPYLRQKAEHMLGEACHQGARATGRDEQFGQASEHLQAAAAQARSSHDLIGEMRVEVNLAELAETRRQPDVAARHYERALELLERMRSALGYEEFQLTFFESLQLTYAGVTEFLLRRNQLDEAFRTTERFRSRLLLSLLGPGEGNSAAWPPDSRIELTDALDHYGEEVMDHCVRETWTECGATTVLGRPRDMTIVTKQPDEMDVSTDRSADFDARRRFLELYESQRLHRPNWQDRQTTPPVGLEDARRLLGQDDALLSYFVAENSVVIFGATQDTSHFQHLAYPGGRLKQDVNEVTQAMARMQDWVLGATDWDPRQTPPAELARITTALHKGLVKLYALLVAPVLPVVAEKPHWLIVPHGPLHRLPWSALRGGGQYLVERKSISLLPSASLGSVLLERRPRATGDALFFGDPDPHDARLQLPGSQREVRAAREKLRSGVPPYIGRAANKQEFMRGAPSAWLLHLACHHLFDADAPPLSFLKLAGDRGSDFLYAFEIAEMNLAAELVVLSACQSAHSRVATGDEQLGIVRSFLAAGASSVVSTLWSIEDESAAEFFAAFYEQAFQVGLAQALTAAQRRLLSDPSYRLPYFWAPYQLIGTWNRPLRR